MRASLLGATAQLLPNSPIGPDLTLRMLRDLTAESLDTDSRTEVLFTRLPH